MRHGHSITAGEYIDAADLLEDAIDQRHLRDALNHHRGEQHGEMREVVQNGHSLQEIRQEWSGL